jgi:cytochrome c-type biogenesis protein CcmH/NrfF
VILLAFVVLAALLIVTQTPRAAAQDGDDFKLPPGVTWDDVNRVAAQIACLVCDDSPLVECETAACSAWKQDIARLLGEGYSDAEIIAYFEERYGKDITVAVREKVNAIASQLTCEDCNGVPLTECESDTCWQWRQQVTKLFTTGSSERDILAYFVTRYGWGVVIGAEIGPSGLRVGVTQDGVNRVASSMYCDVCEGVPLDECESTACRQWRDEIGIMLGLGYTKDEIIDSFVARYGDDVSAVPRDDTDRFLAFAVPIALALLLGIAGAMQVNQLRQRAQQPKAKMKRAANGQLQRPVPDDIAPDYIERLEQDLQRLQ